MRDSLQAVRRAAQHTQGGMDAGEWEREETVGTSSEGKKHTLENGFDGDTY